MDAMEQRQAWDARYVERGARMWSGEVNGAVADEAAGLAPGSALDVGCGEGADALWLAARGWEVTALDVSAVAVERARAAAAAAGSDVRWIADDLVAAGAGGALGEHDLVVAAYPALPRAEGEPAVRALLGAVAPGGTLLAVWHAHVDPEHARAHGFALDAYVQRAEVVAALDPGAWEVVVDEERPRRHPAAAGGHHEDHVLRAVRRG